MIVDAHCHAWPRWPYPVDPGTPRIDVDRHGAVDRLRAEMSSAGVGQAMIVCADIGEPAADDNAYVAAAAAMHPTVLTYVADVDSRWSATYHDAHMDRRIRALPEDPRLVGITHYLADAVDDWWTSPAASRMAEALAERGLLLSLHAPAAWHAAVGTWASEHPHVPVLLHHLGLAREEREISVLLSLASVPNVCVKASGFAYTAPGEGPEFASSGRRLTRIVEAFGPDRVLWGSDFPVSPERGIDYARSLELVVSALAGFGEGARDAVLGDTASALLSGRSS